MLVPQTMFICPPAEAIGAFIRLRGYKSRSWGGWKPGDPSPEWTKHHYDPLEPKLVAMLEPMSLRAAEILAALETHRPAVAPP